ncbi:MAG TPA: hypothetical protein VJW76_05950 [Verrucomicrobiae bacterium]|nr:hypothetical protein [Verrucomicrobiae bacterium]
MKLSTKYSERGFSLVLVLVLVGTAILFLSGALQWSSAGGGLTDRNNDYYSAMAAAEAATEKVIAQIVRDFQRGGYAEVESKLGYYRTLVPTRSESADWANYEFTDADRALNKITVERAQDWQFLPLDWKYAGFNGHRASYRVISNARLTGWGSGAVGTVKQEVQVAEIPLFEFGAFYNLPMEVDSMQHDLSLSGHVHSNTNAFFGPRAPISLTLLGDVTSSGSIVHEHHPSLLLGLLPVGPVNYRGASDAKVTSLNLPLGTNNTPELLHEIIEMPPDLESSQSLLGKQRFYNKADLIILVSNTTVTARSGDANGFQPFSPADYDAMIRPFVSTNAKLWDGRQQKYFHLTEIDVAQLRQNYSAVRSKIGGRDPRIIYVADRRTFSGSPYPAAPAVRIINGQTLPPGVGLTVATMNPLYVKGNFNAHPSFLLSNNTQATEPAALVCDSLTVLSENWNDDAVLVNNLPVNLAALPGTTINAGIITGIVPTGTGVYSGSLENVFSLLENWLVSRFTFNGSLAVLYRSEEATQPYRDPGLYYQPPLLRKINFDNNFKVAGKLPHGTPQLRTMIRSRWSITEVN